MALANKKYERMFSKTGDDADKVSSDQFAEMKADFDTNDYIIDIASLKTLGPALYQIQLIQDELDALRTEISSNKDKSTFPGLGTSSSTALAGNTTVISSSQASAITANTSKVTYDKNLSNTNGMSIVGTVTASKGTYSLILTMTHGRVTKTATINLS